MPTLVITTDAPLVKGPLQGQWTCDDWETLPDDGNRYEVIDGVLYMTTAPSFFHQWIIIQLMYFLGVPARERNLAYVVPSPVGVLMPGCTPVQPDLVVVRTANAAIIYDRRIRGVPDLLLEILSPSNADYDRVVKLDAYARAGLPEYAIVDPRERALSHYTLDEAGHFGAPRVANEDEEVSFDCLPGVVLRVGDLFAGTPDSTL